MPKATTKKKPKKAPAKKAPSSASSSHALAQHRENHKRQREHVAGKLRAAHKAVLSIVDSVHADDADGIAKLRRAVEHAHDNAHAKKGH